MTRIPASLAYAAVLLLTGCGGADSSVEAPLARPASETSADIGAHVVHFSAQTTDQLSPEIAAAYNILRSKNRVMLTVAVIRKSDSLPVPATVSVQTVNLTGQMKDVAMRRIDEQKAIYYIGETPVANRETLVFDISVAPDGVDKPAMVRFQREFFTD